MLGRLIFGTAAALALAFTAYAAGDGSPRVYLLRPSFLHRDATLCPY